MERAFIEAEIIGQTPGGTKRVRILTDGAEGYCFYTNSDNIIRVNEPEERKGEFYWAAMHRYAEEGTESNIEVQNEDWARFFADLNRRMREGYKVIFADIRNRREQTWER